MKIEGKQTAHHTDHERTAPLSAVLRGNRRVIAFAGAVVVVGLVVYLVASGTGRLSKRQHGYRTQGSQYGDEMPPAPVDESQFRQYFSRQIANEHTVDFFKYLQKRFDAQPIEAHYQGVREYLVNQFGEGRADDFMKLYEKYTEYEMTLAQQKQLWDREPPRTTEDAMEFLRDIQKYRAEYFGSDLAEDIFGAEDRYNEYTLRRNDIVKNTQLSGAQKEQSLAALQKSVFGDTGEKAEMSPLERYFSKLRLYEKDLAALSPEKQYEMRQKFRLEIFPPDVAARLDAVDRNQMQYQTKYPSTKKK